MNSTLSGYSPPSWPAPSSVSVDIDCYPSWGITGYMECSAWATGGTGSGYEVTWLNASGWGSYAMVQCPYSSDPSWGAWIDVYVIVLDSGGTGATKWEAFQCPPGWM